jgi:hypothetical protein
MRNSETERQTVEQQLAQTYGQIARQLDIIESLRLQGYPTHGAERLLVDLELLQERHKAHLAQLQIST